jgi:hypothetical protein
LNASANAVPDAAVTPESQSGYFAQLIDVVNALAPLGKFVMQPDSRSQLNQNMIAG